jgi:tetratricopeptide (TPR) repeat protein
MFASVTLVAIVVAAATGASPVQRLLESVPADSLARPLARLEASQRGATAAEAALALGHLHYARGEYRQAVEAFARATPRFDPANRSEPRYWAGLAWLGAGEPAAARGAFEEAARGGSPRRAEALLGVALCWEAARRPERALQTLQTLLAGEAGEAGPAALERTAALATTLRRPELARRARERLLREYPRSMEALRNGPAGAASRGASPTP